MTAVIGILNKEAVAIAADSAVTIGWENGRKIYNTANKIFTLSKYAPVGVALYNSASFMATPWETIVKIYREHLGKKAFGTLEEYQQDFFTFLKEKNYYVDREFQQEFLVQLFVAVFSYINNEAMQQYQHLLTGKAKDQKEVVRLIKAKVKELVDKVPDEYKCCTEFQDYTEIEFETFSNPSFERAFDYVYTENNFTFTPSIKNQFRRICFVHLRSTQFMNLYTGLIFAGFGEDEIYPSLLSVNVSGVFDNKLRYFMDENMVTKITNGMQASIRPFAQTDVINTILSGVDPSLDDFYIYQHGEFLKKSNQAVASLIRSISPDLAAYLENLDVTDIVKEYKKETQMIKQTRYIIPLMSAVANLSKDDLSEMAESLVYLTYLKRRITFAEESVGGPVDVAIISKGDGFIWKKRKHYFKPELNQHFFSNYFKNS